MTDAKVSTVQMDDGAKLYVKLRGDTADKTKPLLIGLHGAPGLITHAELDASLRYLSSSFRVLVFDGRGSGASDKVGPCTHERWMKDIENLRAWAGAETFVLAGHSYGGFLALDHAVNHPNRLRGLVLIDTWTVGTLGAMTALMNMLTSDRVHVDKARQVSSLLIPSYAPPEHAAIKHSAPDATGSTEGFAKLHFHFETQNWAFGYNMPRFDVRQQLKDIKAPTLVTVGRYDYVTPVSFAQELESGIPDSSLEIFEHSGHSPQSDEPEKFRQVLLDFLKARVL
ncbi:hypothetical protein ABEF93_004599 [Exophiala dermatitidis]